MRPWTLNVELATNTTPLLSDLCKVEVTKHAVSNLASGNFVGPILRPLPIKESYGAARERQYTEIGFQVAMQ